MKIALLTDGIFPYVSGGMQKHSFYLAKYFALNKIHVDIFHFNDSDKDIDLLSCFSDEEKVYIRSVVLEFPHSGKYPGHYLMDSFQYSENIFNALKPDLHCYDFIYCKGFAGWKLISEKNKGAKFPPVAVNFHGYEMFQRSADLKSYFQNLFLRVPVKWICSRADFVFSYGSGITTILTKDIGLPLSKIIEAPAGIESSWLHTAVSAVSQPLKFVYVGRYERRKGVEELTETIEDLDSLKLQFTFVGPIPRLKMLTKSNITYYGEIRDTDKLKAILDSAHVIVCPSYSEGMPNVIMEGMARGLAVLSTSVGAIPDLVDQGNGILISPGDRVQLRDALLRFIQMSPEELQTMKENSLRRIKENFLLENTFRKTLNKIIAISSEKTLDL